MKRLVTLTTVLATLPGPVLAQDEWRTDFSRHTVPLDEIVSRGPPKDGIPAIDDPRFVSVSEADGWLEVNEPVIVVRHGKDTRAYPYQILIFHEIVNDVVGGRPLAVTYCPEPERGTGDLPVHPRLDQRGARRRGAVQLEEELWSSPKSATRSTRARRTENAAGASGRSSLRGKTLSAGWA